MWCLLLVTSFIILFNKSRDAFMVIVNYINLSILEEFIKKMFKKYFSHFQKKIDLKNICKNCKCFQVPFSKDISC